MKHPKHRHCYTTAFKRAVIEYAKEHGNWAAEWQFGLPPTTEKMIQTWRKQEQQLKEANPNIHNLRRGTANWSELEEELKTWISDQRRSGITVSTKMIIHRARLLATDRNIIDRDSF
jgi:hypothetical protein